MQIHRKSDLSLLVQMGFMEVNFILNCLHVSFVVKSMRRKPVGLVLKLNQLLFSFYFLSFRREGNQNLFYFISFGGISCCEQQKYHGGQEIIHFVFEIAKRDGTHFSLEAPIAGLETKRCCARFDNLLGEKNEREERM